MKRFLLGFLSLTLLGCNGNILFQQRIELPNNTWSYSNPLEFSMEIEENQNSYDLLIDVEHSRDFGYGNLYTGLTIITPGTDTSFQRISIDLADKLGQWLGTCKGNECSLQFPISEGHQFSGSGTQKVILEQYSREEDLKGIKSIELTIQYAGT